MGLAAVAGIFPVVDFFSKLPSLLLHKRILSILLDTRTIGEQDELEVSLFRAKLPLRSPNAVSLKAKLRIER